MKYLGKAALTAAFFFWSLAGLAYDYHHTDRFVATVVGTPAEYHAKLPKSIPFKKRKLLVFPDRVVPDALWYDSEMYYSEALQKEAAADKGNVED